MLYSCSHLHGPSSSRFRILAFISNRNPLSLYPRSSSWHTLSMWSIEIMMSLKLGENAPNCESNGRNLSPYWLANRKKGTWGMLHCALSRSRAASVRIEMILSQNKLVIKIFWIFCAKRPHPRLSSGYFSTSFSQFKCRFPTPLTLISPSGNLMWNEVPVIHDT
jgi:hypothetical protein